MLTSLYVWAMRNAAEAYRRIQTDALFARLYRMAKRAITGFKKQLVAWMKKGGAEVDAMAKQPPDMAKVENVLQHHGYDVELPEQKKAASAQKATPTRATKEQER